MTYKNYINNEDYYIDYIYNEFGDLVIENYYDDDGIFKYIDYIYEE